MAGKSNVRSYLKWESDLPPKEAYSSVNELSLYLYLRELGLVHQKAFCLAEWDMSMEIQSLTAQSRRDKSEDCHQGAYFSEHLQCPALALNKY